MSFYIDFFTNSLNSPGIVDIYIPGRDESKPLRGILASEINIGLKNTFGNALPSLDSLSDAFQLMSAPFVPAWIGASTQIWKGTDLLRLAFEFYLVNYEPNINPSHEDSLKALTKLATMMKDDGSYGEGNTKVTGKFFAKVHGGYRPDPFASNEKRFLGGNLSETTLSSLAGIGIGEASRDGTITIKVGRNFSLSGLLLTKIDITPSVVEVGNKYNSKPLYYRVSVNMQTSRVALETDVDQMFGG